tara:strand:+ start:562 stop:1089 length:528 start_codon:yes stop_codon:yes gene_type:complete
MGCNSNFKGGARKSNFAASNCEDLIGQAEFGLEDCTFHGLSPNGNCVFLCPTGLREVEAGSDKMPLRKSASLKRSKPNKAQRLSDVRKKSFVGERKRTAFSMGGFKKRFDDNQKKFSSFMGKVGMQKNHNFVDIKKHGISEEEYFAYNPKHSTSFSNFTDGRGFKHNNELNEYDY